MSYRNCYYSNKAKQIALFTWNTDGERIRVEVPFQPYLYVEDDRGEKTSVYGTKVRKKIFASSYDRNKFVNDSGIKRLYENFSPVHQYLIDTFWTENEKPEFTQHPLKIVLFDIETEVRDFKPDHKIQARELKKDTTSMMTLKKFRASCVDTHEVLDEIKNEWVNIKLSCYNTKTSFPNTNDPQHEINLITCYDNLTQTYHTFGLKPYQPDDKSVRYIHCQTERELFNKFLEYMEADYPDVLSGWGSENFDIPYTINRLERVLGAEAVKRLSPVGSVFFRDIVGKFGKAQKRYYIDGISCIDYLEIYRKFCGKLRESYKLDAIAELELGEKKTLLGDTDLGTLADLNWELFTTYNIQDVRLLVKLEDKLQYINLLRNIAYIGLTSLDGAMGTLQGTTGALAIRARHRSEVLATFVRGDGSGKNPGAYVAEPLHGFQRNVVSFDANSLYPNIMISLNLSPETKVGKVMVSGDMVNIHHVSGKHFELTKANFMKYLKDEELSLTKAGILFSQKKQGLLPEYLDYYYKQRVKVQGELKNTKKEYADTKDSLSPAEKKQIEYTIQRLHTTQLVQKILLNSAFGYCGNKQAPYGDDEIASSITLTGQAVIKQAAIIVKKHLKEKFSLGDLEVRDSLKYGDTDSCYFGFDCIEDRVPLMRGDTINPDFYTLIDDIEETLNVQIIKWAQTALNSRDCRLKFKREAIASCGIFLMKKRYVLHVLDDEGIVGSKYKYTGVDVVRTTMPNALKPYAKKIIETMMQTQSVTTTNAVLNETYETFMGLKPTEIAFVKGLKGYEAYAANCNNFQVAKKMPIHAKAAYYYNLLIKQLGIDNKYEQISSGDKVRFLYLETPNKYNISCIGFKYELPPEILSLVRIDYEKMFEKIMFSAIERFYNCVNWQIRKPNQNVRVELFDLFG